MWFKMVCGLLLLPLFLGYEWLPTEVIKEAKEAFEMKEGRREKPESGEPDLRSVAPFIASDSFREHFQPRTCLSQNKCHMDFKLHTNAGDAIYVEGNCLSYFVVNIVPKLRVPYVLVVHEGPPGFPDELTQPILRREYQEGRLLAYHGQGLWWKGYESGMLRPAYLHCLPRGLDSRERSQGSCPGLYVKALARLARKRDAQAQAPTGGEKPLLLLNSELLLPSMGLHHVDRATAQLAQLRKLFSSSEFGFNITKLESEEAWLAAISEHRFTLVPTSHASSDSHRIMDVLLMGGVPVVHESSASSCYDDSDNQVNLTSTRGALPIVIVDDWKHVTNRFLHDEWSRISSVPPKRWDASRLFVDHWLARIASYNQLFAQDAWPEITSRLPAHMYLHNEPVRGLNGRGW